MNEHGPMAVDCVQFVSITSHHLLLTTIMYASVILYASVKRFKDSQELDTALYKCVPLLFNVLHVHEAFVLLSVVVVWLRWH